MVYIERIHTFLNHFSYFIAQNVFILLQKLLRNVTHIHFLTGSPVMLFYNGFHIYLFALLILFLNLTLLLILAYLSLSLLESLLMVILLLEY